MSNDLTCIRSCHISQFVFRFSNNEKEKVKCFARKDHSNSSFKLFIYVKDNIHSFKMVLMTMIARVVDGLPLAATMQEDEQSGCNILEYQNQAKMLFRKLGPQSPLRCSIETGPYLFHYLIENEICYLVLCERNYSKRLAFSYLEEIAQEFYQQYGKRVNTVTRPYTFIEFDTWMQRARKQYSEGGARARRAGAAAQLGGQLGDVQRIMMQNIDDVLQRGAVLSELDTKTQNLSMMSQKYKKDATYLNTKSMLVKATAGAVILLVFVLYFWVL